MKEWLTLFFKNKKSILTLNGQTFSVDDCEHIGSGSEKNVYKIKNTSQCFFIPHKWSSEADWNMQIKAEKQLLDYMATLGLKTQHFEIFPLTIQAEDNVPQTIQVLVTKDFKNLCQEESLVIYNRKADPHLRAIGNFPNIALLKEQLKNKDFAQEMLKKIIKEYATAFTFMLPITALSPTDDSEHFCFELSADPTLPPVARYMFWDVVSDSAGILEPHVPTLKDFKAGQWDEKHPKRDPLAGLKNLANNIACAIYEMTDPSIKSDALFNELEQNLLSAINEDDILNEALDSARLVAKSKMIETLKDYGDKIAKLDNESFVGFMHSLISINDLELVKTGLLIYSNYEKLTEENISEITNAALQYENNDIIVHIKNHFSLIQEKIAQEKLAQAKAAQEKIAQEKQEQRIQLKQTFFTNYNLKLDADKKSWFGCYSFFAKSYVTDSMSLKELVDHAQGLSAEGSGKRSKKVMKEMGWLDENNQVINEISNLI